MYSSKEAYEYCQDVASVIAASDESLNGILYESVQRKQEANNIILFEHREAEQSIKIEPGTNHCVVSKHYGADLIMESKRSKTILPRRVIDALNQYHFDTEDLP